MMIIYYGFLKSEYGEFLLGVKDNALLFLYSEKTSLDEVRIIYQDYILKRDEGKIEPFLREISLYLLGKRKNFSFPIILQGTKFCQLVWQELLKIPYGEVVYYSDIAKSLGGINMRRAVARGIARNPLLIVIPCHRVISKNGLGGYSGGVELKKKLLNLEKK